MPGTGHLFLLPPLVAAVEDCSFDSEGKDSASRVKWFETWGCEHGA